MSQSTCDKCGYPVPLSNDATVIQAELTKSPFTIIGNKARHFLPTEHCPGSPSRAQYIKGQPKDQRGGYDKAMEKPWRKALKAVQKRNK